MAGSQPFFLTGSNAVIVLNSRPVAYATDISYSVDVRHAKPRVLGRFEVETVQPLSYDVIGTLTIIRYARGLKDIIAGAPADADQAGNGIGSFSASNGTTITGVLGLPSGGQYDGGTADNFNPGRFFQSKMFDIEIRQKLNNAEKVDTKIVFRLRDCRFTSLDFKLSKRGLPMQTMGFAARYADDDTYLASKSGVGQELT